MTSRVTCRYETAARYECVVGSRKPGPDEGVLRWIHGLYDDRTFIGIVSIAEIRRGVALMDKGRKREALGEWLAHDVPQRFEHRIIPVQAHVALPSGDLMALAERSGRGLASMNELIAASAVAHHLTLATRNTKDFEGLGVDVLNPWAA